MIRKAAHSREYLTAFAYPLRAWRAASFSVHILLALLMFCSSFEALADELRVTTPSRAILNINLISAQKEENQALSFSNTVVDKTVLRLKTQFNDAITFTAVNFRDIVSFNLSVFMKEVVMNNVTFERFFNASWAIFNGHVTLFDVRFKDSVGLFYCVFAQPAKFYHVVSEKEVTFQKSKFNQEFEYSHSTFLGDTSFYGARFKDIALFRLDEFAKGVDFSYARFDKGLEFADVIFKGLTNFSNASFHGKVSFNRSQISGILDLSNVEIFGDEIDLTQLEKKNNNQRIKINLTGSAIDKINFYYTDFELYFPDNVLESEKLLVYKSLLNNFQRRGYTSSYERLYPEAEEYNYLRKDQTFFNLVQKYWWNYGINKEKIFHWVAFFLIFFTLINSFFFSSLLKKYCSVPFLESATKDYSIISNPVTRYIYYLPGAFVFTVILFFGGFLRMGISIKDFTSHNMLVNLYLMLIICVGTVCILYIFKYFLN